MINTEPMGILAKMALFKLAIGEPDDDESAP